MNQQIDDILSSNVCKVIVNDEDKHGTGFLISNEYILTAYHVVRDSLDDIKVRFESFEKDIDVEVSNLIDNTYKELDVVLLKVEDKVLNWYKELKFMETKLSYGLPWRTMGFPQLKDGDMIGYTINRHRNEKVNKHDLELDVDTGKHISFQGLSGAPVIVNNSIVGIINQDLSNGVQAVELKALSVKYFKNLLEKLHIKIENGNIEQLDNKDLLSTERWDKLSKPEDYRNLREKILAVCSEISSRKIDNYNSTMVLGKEEQIYRDEREISAIKYIIFRKCQSELVDFCDDNVNKKELSKKELEELINLYVDKAKVIIDDKRQEFNYNNYSEDFIRKIVLNLIEDCFLSFDEDGIYEEK